ncbi:MAG TPA: hypothetical protein VMG12_29275 [Polyangiaceae bacterium]|nr:hypothetical protein [Polyangiaceae bacterium]
MIALGLFSSAAPGGAAAPAVPDAARSRRVTRWAAAASLLPLPLWFITSALLAPAPAWRGEYRENAGFTGAGAVLHERLLQRYWDKSYPAVPGDLSYKSFVARWDTCLSSNEAHDVPFMLVADGSATLTIDGAERLRAQSASGMRATRGDTIRLEPGTHHLHVELTPRGWPSIALLASFDGGPPSPIGSGQLAKGVTTAPPKDGAAPCTSP